MKFDFFPLKSSIGLSGLMQKYLSNDPSIAPFTNGAPSLEKMMSAANASRFNMNQRTLLAEALKNQHSHYPSIQNRIDVFLNENTFTVTTGHQLCLATGPLYFIYKIASACALARMLNEKDPSKKYIPIYWMASEDHDVEEINHAYFFNKKVVWETEQKGAVGRFELNDIAGFIDAVKIVLGESEKQIVWNDLLQRAYHAKTLAEATRQLVYGIFGENEIVVIDADDHTLKSAFAPILKKEILNRASFDQVITANAQLEKLGVKSQVMPREINLFYLENQSRERIKFEGNYQIGGTVFHQEKLAEEIDITPEKFSPNVVLRPVYQECILPNIAYIGGPGELAYWHQLKGVFSLYEIPFPELVLRDSALILTSGFMKRLQKLQLEVSHLFGDKNAIIEGWIKDAGLFDLEDEKKALEELFNQVIGKAERADQTLTGSAQAEGKKILNSFENLEKKITKAFKAREDQKIQQLEKLWSEVFPDGVPQERHDNFFQFAAKCPEGFIESLIQNFNPLKAELKVIYLED
jgi:bacillithiol biosynthesis cysteine-adding enzyme BshC